MHQLNVEALEAVLNDCRNNLEEIDIGKISDTSILARSSFIGDTDVLEEWLATEYVE